MSKSVGSISVSLQTWCTWPVVLDEDSTYSLCSASFVSSTYVFVLLLFARALKITMDVGTVILRVAEACAYSGMVLIVCRSDFWTTFD